MTEEELQLLIEVRQAIATGRATRVRELAGLSRSELARRVGVRPATVSRWEAGVRRPGGKQALAYGRALREITEGLAIHG
jgi:DNA-binding transcriptional regulator YiaG